jgi:uncharacterized membrane protein
LAGWRDVCAVPELSLGYGAVFAVAAGIIFLALMAAGWESLMIPLSSGFLLIGPLMAVGLYDASRRLEKGERPRLSEVALAGLSTPGQVGFLGALLMLVYYASIQVSLLLFMLFIGTRSLPSANELVQTLFYTPEGQRLLAAEIIVSVGLAMMVFTLSVVSIPLMLDRPIDAVSAMATSLQAVRRNPWVMALWAMLIVVLMLVGFATALIGLVLIFPLIGHASWHAFEDLVAPEGPRS